MTLSYHTSAGEVDQGTPLSAKLVQSSQHRQAQDDIQIGGDLDEQLKISFQRTIRVPDGKGASALPPSKGAFPLYPVTQYTNTLPSAMSLKGGLFFPMYKREAMWIKFTSDKEFAIKLHVGNVNAVCGEPKHETGATTLRRQTHLAQNKSVQDYVVTPQQLWIDGIATQEGIVRQFLAMLLGSGYSVEAQVTGQGVVGGLQFFITAVKQPKRTSVGPCKSLQIKSLTGKVFDLTGLSSNTTINEVKLRIHEKEGIPENQQRLIYGGRHCADDAMLGYYRLLDYAIVHLVTCLRGGGFPPVEMGIAAGGRIKQCILPDENPASTWDTGRSIGFNVQILNSELFRQVTGTNPPETPISAITYAEQGFPFFQIWNETSSIKGDFKAVKSVKAIYDGKKKEKGGEIAEELPWSGPVITLDPEGKHMKFVPVSVMMADLARTRYASF